MLGRVTTPLLPDDYLHLANPLWSARELRGQIVEVRKETADSATLVIKPGLGIRLRLPAGPVHRHRRAHRRTLALAVVLAHLVAELERRSSSRSPSRRCPRVSCRATSSTVCPSGTIVRLAAPQGNFALPEPPPKKILFLTAGSGITPVMAMLRTMDHRDELPDVIHVHSAPTADDVMFADELADAARRATRLPVASPAHPHRGKFDLSSLDAVYPDWRERQTWACGPLADARRDRARCGETRASRTGCTSSGSTIARSADAGEGGTVTFAKADRKRRRSTVRPPCCRPVRSRASRCRSAAGWESARPVSSPFSTGHTPRPAVG